MPSSLVGSKRAWLQACAHHAPIHKWRAGPCTLQTSGAAIVHQHDCLSCVEACVASPKGLRKCYCVLHSALPIPRLYFKLVHYYG
jgi:hypothetical protein